MSRDGDSTVIRFVNDPRCFVLRINLTTPFLDVFIDIEAVLGLTTQILFHLFLGVSKEGTMEVSQRAGSDGST